VTGKRLLYPRRAALLQPVPLPQLLPQPLLPPLRCCCPHHCAAAAAATNAATAAAPAHVAAAAAALPLPLLLPLSLPLPPGDQSSDKAITMLIFICNYHRKQHPPHGIEGGSGISSLWQYKNASLSLYITKGAPIDPHQRLTLFY
jgi:hypothetical protein